eukprot:GHRQ01022187.1.p2 GENE.GHRQ01022187.1~~GHRQ01022187.1.p2  ORF type:complete len:140 (+),score=18.16 GHRQ01022187.1:391-810(+)
MSNTKLTRASEATRTRKAQVHILDNTLQKPSICCRLLLLLAMPLVPTPYAAAARTSSHTVTAGASSCCLWASLIRADRLLRCCQQPHLAVASAEQHFCDLARTTLALLSTLVDRCVHACRQTGDRHKMLLRLCKHPVAL